MGPSAMHRPFWRIILSSQAQMIDPSLVDENMAQGWGLGGEGGG